MPKRWKEITNGGGAVVEFSVIAECWTYTCEWGCWAYEFETEEEALDALLNHDCQRGM